MAKKTSAEWPEGRPGYGEVKPRVLSRADGTPYQNYYGCYNSDPRGKGKRSYVSHRTKKGAVDKLRIAMNEVDSGTHAKKKGMNTVKQTIDEYLDDLDGVTEAYRGNEKSHLRKWSSSNLANMNLSEFKDSSLIELEYKAMRRRGGAARSRNAVIKALSRVFTFAVKRKYIPRNVLAPGNHPIKLDKPPKKQNALTPEDAAILLQEARNLQASSRYVNTWINFYAILCLLAATGARPEEVGALHVTDVQRFGGPHPQRPSSWARLTYRRRYTRRDRFRDGLKEGADERSCDLGKRAVHALNLVERSWQAHRWATGPGHEAYHSFAISGRVDRFMSHHNDPLEIRKHGLLFVNRHGLPYSCESLSYLMTKLCLRTGLVKRDIEGRIILGKNGKSKPKYTLYSWRKLVTNYNIRRLPLNVAAAVTGHSEKTLLLNYTQTSERDDALAGEVMGELEDELFATEVQLRLVSGGK